MRSVEKIEAKSTNEETPLNPTWELLGRNAQYSPHTLDSILRGLRIYAGNTRKDRQAWQRKRAIRKNPELVLQKPTKKPEYVPEIDLSEFLPQIDHILVEAEEFQIDEEPKDPLWPEAADAYIATTISPVKPNLRLIFTEPR